MNMNAQTEGATSDPNLTTLHERLDMLTGRLEGFRGQASIATDRIWGTRPDVAAPEIAGKVQSVQDMGMIHTLNTQLNYINSICDDIHHELQRLGEV